MPFTYSKSIKHSFIATSLVILSLSSFNISASIWDTSIWGNQSTAIKNNAKAKEIVIQKGDTLSKIFTNAHLPLTDMRALGAEEIKQLTILHPGATLILLPKEHHLQALQYTTKNGTTHLLTRSGHTYTDKQSIQKLEMTVDYRATPIIGSLTLSEKKAGIGKIARQDITKIFSGMLNLNRDLHRGDQLGVLYNAYYLNGVKHHDGHAIAAVLKTKNHTFAAYRYQCPHSVPGYYLSNGSSINHLFLDFPLKFKRISSRFNLHRLDPVTHKIAPHLGVDLAARSGTPIKSIGSGRVIYAGWAHGFGNTIKISHGHHRVSLYAHLSKFRPHLHIGQRVGRGDLIAYVGQTGWTTGPHLHFGFYVKGRAVDWLKYYQPKAPGIPRKEKANFKEQVTALQAQLALYSKTDNMA